MKSKWFLLGVLAALGTACSGSILDPSSGEGSGYGGLDAHGDGTSSSGERDAAGEDLPDTDPGRVTLHRLNRVEYTNTTRDLLGTTLRPADDFPPDDRGYGYDNIADVLSLSPVQVEMYWNAASSFVEEAMNVVRVGARRYEAEAMAASTGAAFGADAWNLYSSGSLTQSVPIDTKGEYRIRVRAWAQQGGPDLAQMSIDVNALPVVTLDVPAAESAPAIYEATATLEPGNAILGASFLNDFYDSATGADRNLIVDYLEIEGPLGVTAGNPLRGRIMVCEPEPSQPEVCLRQVAQSFGRRAFRRPLGSAEVDALVALPTAALAAGDDLETATRSMLQAILVSPQFLFRVELDTDPEAETPHALTQHELASRLSYFLWSSMPDDALLDAADRGELADDAKLRAQVTRMLKDPKSRALLDNFAGQWLFIRAIADHAPDANYFPAFDESLRGAMREETERYVSDFLFGDETLDHLLTADYSYLNARLAAHYGLPAPSADFARVTLAGSQRAGLLTQASLLMVTSYATRTSPVKRGKWVLDQLLCTPPPPPPPGVEGLVKEDVPTGSLRERMEAHRANPVCASCHKQMDPIGFGFEQYDAIGKFRTDDNGFDIDPSGMLPDGTKFAGPLELAPLIAQDPRFARCVTQQLLTYALGRGTEPYDDGDIDAITASFVSSGYAFRELLQDVVISDAFRMRRGEPAAGTDTTRSTEQKP